MSLMNRRALTGSTLFGLAVMFIALLMLSSLLFRGWRLDLTQDRLYTLSEGTRSLIGKIDEPVRLRMYFSESAAKDYPALRTCANRVREMLEEMVAVSAGKLSLEVVDPQPFSEDEDRATAAGLQAVPLGAAARPCSLAWLAAMHWMVRPPSHSFSQTRKPSLNTTSPS